MKANSYLNAGVVALLLACTACGKKKKPAGAFGIKYEQYSIQGKMLYQTHCLNCHQADGSGLGRLIPPLRTDFIRENKALSICAIKYGMEGEIIVNDTVYNGRMPANPRLTPIEIAEIMTYIANAWGNEGGIVTQKETEQALKNCKR